MKTRISIFGILALLALVVGFVPAVLVAEPAKPAG